MKRFHLGFYHYTYDIHGNVNTLVTELKEMGSQKLKRIDYDYDLLSGKVNECVYQKGQADQLLHRYNYDADNRITQAYTSTDGLHWNSEARYDYYRHGPLARTELGEHNIQGLDHAYTIQGWIKGVNSATLTAQRDIGKDAAQGIHQSFAKDQAGYTLGYFENDYKSIETYSDQDRFHTGTFDPKEASNVVSGKIGANLYNGNISHMVTAIQKFIDDALTDKDKQIMYSAYRYDQLNRIKEVKKYTADNLLSLNKWPVLTAAPPDNVNKEYRETFSFDKNGNITTLRRNDKVGNAIDDFEYKYHNIENGYQENTNKLRWVQDAVADNKSTEDIDNQAKDNYVYDAIGNLIHDKKEGIEEIRWNVSGKVTDVIRTTALAQTKGNLHFEYDATGQRASKTVNTRDVEGNYHYKTTYYVRDASGNVMGHYTQEDGHKILLTEQPIYGSSRLGMKSINKALDDASFVIPNNHHYDPNNANHVLLQGDGNYNLTEGQEAYIVQGSDFTGNVVLNSGNNLYVLGNAKINSITHHQATSYVHVYGQLEIDHVQSEASVYYQNYNKLIVHGNLDFPEGGYMSTEAGAQTIIEGNLTMNCTMLNGGDLKVMGNMQLLSNAYFMASGSIQVAGDLALHCDGVMGAAHPLMVGSLHLYGNADLSQTDDRMFAELKVNAILDLAPNTQLIGYIKLCVGGAITGTGTIDPHVQTTACSTMLAVAPGEETHTSTLGKTSYELSNHLGNVLAVVTDKKALVTLSGVPSWTSDVVSATDYYAFGSSLKSSGTYRYGFNGKEKQSEISEGGYDLGARYFDTRLGRMFSPDPREGEYTWQSTFAYFGNSPISKLDWNGEGDYYGKDGTHYGSDKKTILNKAGKEVSDNKAYIVSESAVKDASLANNKYDCLASNSTTILLDATNDMVKCMAGVIDREVKTGPMNEKKALGGAVVNISGSKLERSLTISNPHFNASYNPIVPLAPKNSDNVVKSSFEAALYVLNGGKDLSNGAKNWDGVDQAALDPKGETFVGIYTNKALAMGWVISDKHYKTWKNAISEDAVGKKMLANYNKQFGTSGFMAEQSTVAKGGVKGKTNYDFNKGKQRLSSSACYGTTIFWKID